MADQSNKLVKVRIEVLENKNKKQKRSILYFKIML